MAPVTAPTNDRPDSPVWSLPSSLTIVGETLVQRGAAGVLKLGRPGVGGADEDEDARAGLPRRVDQRLQGIPAEQWVGGEGVGAQARHRAEGPRGLPHQRLGVGGSRDRHVAALAVGDHEQAVVAGDRDRALECLPAGRAQALEAGHLELHRDARGSGRHDRGPAVLGDRVGRSGAREASAGLALPLRHGPGPQGRRIGVQPEHDATATLFHERRQPVGEVRPWSGARPATARAPLLPAWSGAARPTPGSAPRTSSRGQPPVKGEEARANPVRATRGTTPGPSLARLARTTPSPAFRPGSARGRGFATA